VLEVSRAVAAWAAIQGFTRQWSEERWLKHTIELTRDDFKPPVMTPPAKYGRRRRAISRVSVTEDPVSPGRVSQVVSADIGEKTAFSDDSPPLTLGSAAKSSFPARSNYETWNNVRRLSKIVLAGYGGVGLLFFGAPLYPDDSHSAHIKQDAKKSEQDILVHAVEDAEAEALSTSQPHISFPSRVTETTTSHQQTNSAPVTAVSSYSWWNVLLGKHDRDIFEGFAFRSSADLDREQINHYSNSQSLASSPISTKSTYFPSSPSQEKIPFVDGRGIPTTEKPLNKSKLIPSTATVGDMRDMPRFWVLTDHVRRQVVLVVRGMLVASLSPKLTSYLLFPGTMSFNELAAVSHFKFISAALTVVLKFIIIIRILPVNQRRLFPLLCLLLRRHRRMTYVNRR
jgi:hypothetical protein